MIQTDLVQHYRHLRGIAGDIQNAAVDLVQHSTMMEFGRRLGLVRGGELFLDDEENKVLCDLAIHTARPGRSRAIDRYARTAAFFPGNDEGRVLAALQKAQFTMFKIESRRAVAGAIAYDVLLEQSFHLMDVAIGLSARPGDGFVGRVVEIDGFRMSCLSLVPLLRELLEHALPRMPDSVAVPEINAFQDPRCAIAIYRSAIELGFMQRTVSFDVVNELPTAQNVAALLNDRPPVDLPKLTLVY
jgi:hypothetical protein